MPIRQHSQIRYATEIARLMGENRYALDLETRYKRRLAGVKEIGDWLQRERIQREVSLESIGEETKISVRYLRALEEGEFDRLPGEPYVKGFIRTYARAVGFDPDPIVQRYKELRAEEAGAMEPTKAHTSRGRAFLTKVNETLQWLGL